MPRKSTTKKQPAAIEYITPFICGSDISRLEYLRPKKVASPSRTSSDEDAFNPKKVKQWIVTQKALAASERKGLGRKLRVQSRTLQAMKLTLKIYRDTYVQEIGLMIFMESIKKKRLGM